MAWGGKFTRMTEKQRRSFLRTSNRSLPLRENPLGVPRSVMKQISDKRLAEDPVTFNARLQELLAAYKLNGG